MFQSQVYAAHMIANSVTVLGLAYEAQLNDGHWLFTACKAWLTDIEQAASKINPEFMGFSVLCPESELVFLNETSPSETVWDVKKRIKQAVQSSEMLIPKPTIELHIKKPLLRMIVRSIQSGFDFEIRPEDTAYVEDGDPGNWRPIKARRHPRLWVNGAQVQLLDDEAQKEFKVMMEGYEVKP